MKNRTRVWQIVRNLSIQSYLTIIFLNKIVNLLNV